MKSSDMRAKARAIFGSAIAEPMPKQPNGAKALQQRANARPIPTYKVGGVVKKKNGGAKLLPTGEITGAVRDLYKQSLANASGSKYIRESHPGMAGENVKKPTSPASGATPPGMSSKPVKKKAVGGVVKKAAGGMPVSTGSPTMRSTGSPTAMRSTGSPTTMRSTGSPTAMRSTGSPTMRSTGSPVSTAMPVSTKSPTGATPPGMRSKLVKKAAGGVMKKSPPGPTAAEREEARRQNERLKKAKVTPKEGKVIDSANRSEGSMYKKGGSVMKKAAGGSTSPFGKAFADARKRGEKTFNFGGKSYTTETREDVQKRAMAASAEREKRTEGNRAAMRQKTAAGTEERGKSSFQRSTDKFYKKYPEAMKKGGKPKDGLAVMIAIGKPMKGMKKPVKRAVGGAGKTRKGMC